MPTWRQGRRLGRWLVSAGALGASVAMLAAVAGSSAAARSAASCSQEKPFIAGTPSESLLSILGVLRRPATPADALPASIKEVLSGPPFRTLGREIFANYIRRARVFAAIPYYVMPVLYTGCGALKRGEGTLLWGGGGGAGTAATIEQGSAYGTLGSFGHTTIQTLVPDGVATVTLHYPAGKIGGFDRTYAPALTTTANVLGNLLILSVPRVGKRLVAPMTMTWRASNGAIVKTFNRL